MADETVPGALGDATGVGIRDLRMTIDALAECVAAMEAVPVAGSWPKARADFGFGALHRILAEMIVNAAWTVGGKWEGRFSAVVVAASRVTDIEDQRALLDRAALRAAEKALTNELLKCPQVIEDGARSIEWVVRELANLGMAGAEEAKAARAALMGAMHVAQAYVACDLDDDDSCQRLRPTLQRIGRRGAEAKHAGTRALKKWALAQAATLKGADMAVARDLAKALPAHFAQVSGDPERLIYDALRARKGTDGR